MAELTLFRSGYIAILGVPNTGKSTLLNSILEQKIAITSSKPQTTRNLILGIKNLENAQLIFLDTPGIHQSTKKFNQRLVKAALSTLDEATVVLWLVDASHPYDADDPLLIEKISAAEKPAVLALNKIDLVRKPDLLHTIDSYRKVHEFRAIVPISALRGEGIGILIEEIVRSLPEGPQYFPPDMVTDISERFLSAELVREKVLQYCHEEIPYAVAVTIDSFQEKKEKRLAVIHATIQVERSSQKGILIGKQGLMLKKIGQMARKEIEFMLEMKVFLDLHVTVSKNWRENEKILGELGY